MTPELISPDKPIKKWSDLEAYLGHPEVVVVNARWEEHGLITLRRREIICILEDLKDDLLVLSCVSENHFKSFQNHDLANITIRNSPLFPEGVFRYCFEAEYLGQNNSHNYLFRYTGKSIEEAKRTHRRTIFNPPLEAQISIPNQDLKKDLEREIQWLEIEREGPIQEPNGSLFRLKHQLYSKFGKSQQIIKNRAEFYKCKLLDISEGGAQISLNRNINSLILFLNSLIPIRSDRRLEILAFSEVTQRRMVEEEFVLHLKFLKSFKEFRGIFLMLGLNY